MYKISVIIPLYNKESYCEEAINSVLAQSYSEFELIIINDGSTDKSKERALLVIEAESRARLIHQDNQGVSAARNRGVKEANYEYLAFLDADDLWHPRYLENMVKALYLYPDEQWFGASFKRFSGDIDMPELDEIPLFSKLNYFLGSFHHSTRKEYNASLVYSDSFIVTKEAFAHVGGYPIGMTYSEDVYFYHKMALLYDIVWSPVELTFYRVGVKEQAISQLLDKPLASFIVDSLSDPSITRKAHEYDFMAYQAIRWMYFKVNSGLFHSKLQKLPLHYMLLSMHSDYFRLNILVRYLPAALLFRFNAHLGKWYLMITSTHKWRSLIKRFL